MNLTLSRVGDAYSSNAEAVNTVTRVKQCLTSRTELSTGNRATYKTVVMAFYLGYQFLLPKRCELWHPGTLP